MKKLIAIILSVVVLCFLVTSCSKDSSISTEDELKTLVLSEVTHSIFYAPQYVAMSEGYFEQEGLEIELINGGGADNVMTAVLTNSADIGLAGAEASIYVYNQGSDNTPKIFAQLTACDGSFLISRQDIDAFSWSDVEGSVILPGRKGGMPYMTLLYVLNENGLIVGEDVFFDDSIDFTAMTGAFTSGTGDFVTAFEPTASNLEKEGKGFVVASIGKEGGSVPYTAYFASDSLDDETIQKFTNAIAKGQEFVKDNTAQVIAKSIEPYFSDTDIETIQTVVQNYKDIGAYSTAPDMKEEDFDRIIDIMENAGELSEEDVIPFDEIIDNSFAFNIK